MQTIAIILAVLITTLVIFVLNIPNIVVIKKHNRLRTIKEMGAYRYVWKIQKKFLWWWVDATDKKRVEITFPHPSEALNYIDIHHKQKKKRRFRKDTCPIMKPVHRNPHLETKTNNQ